MNQLTSKEETDQLYHILSLLEVTYSSKETDKIKAAQDQLQTFSSNMPSGFANLLFKSLLLTSIKEKTISLELHKSAIIYLRNIILKNSGALKVEEIYESLKKFISLLFSWDKNINLNNNTISTILQNIVSFFLSLENFKEDDKYLESLFSEIKKILMENNSYTNENNILITCDKIIGLSKSILTSKNIKPEVNEHLLNDFFFPISDKILDLCKNYINPNQNIYNDNYFKILNKLFESIYNILLHFNAFNQSIKDLCLKIFNKYWKFFPELIELNPPLDELNTKKFGTSNPLIILNINEENCKEINLMKSKIIQIVAFLTQNLYNISNDLDFNKNAKQQINDENITNFLINLVKLTVKCFGDILSNKDKFFFIRDYELETSQEEENSVNIVLYDLCVLLTRILIRDPFKNIFRKDMKLFLLNILLPLFSTNDSERNMIESDFDMYHDYLIDIIENFKMKNFRASGLFLISKICNFFGDENSFLLSFILEMFNYTINEGKINNQVNYNIYIENKDKYTVDKLDNETKIDLFFLLILLLRDRITSNNLIRNRLRDLLIQNQLKLHQINSLSIKIKICKIYSTFIPLLFKEEENTNISQKKNFYHDINSIKNQKEKDKNENNTFSEEHYIFIKNAIEYLLKNIEQNISQNLNKSNKNNYCQSLSHSAAESISELIISFKETTYEENEEGPVFKNEKKQVIEYISKSLSESFKNIINLIIYIDNQSFYNIIDYVLEYIKPKDRQDIFICLKNITEKFIEDYKKSIDKEDSMSPFIIEYFKIIGDFLKGENKPNKNNKKEIELIEEILNKLFECININELEKFEESDELIEMMEEYIILLENISEKSIIIFNKILPIIKNDNTCTNSLFSFLCTFLKYLPKSNNLDPNIKIQLTSEIIKIIKLSLSVDDELLNNSVKHALLLTLKLFNIGIKDIPFDLLKELLILSLNSFAPISKEDLFIGNISHKILINQIILTNISFGFIFKPVETYKIIFEKNEENQKNIQNKLEDNKDNNNKENNKKDYNPNLHLFINLILSQIGMATNDYIVLLNKCLILGLCSIFKEKYCLEKLNNDKSIKILMIQILAKLIEKHRKQQVDQLNKIMKRETNCNFIEESEVEEEEDEESEELEDFKETIKEIFSENENIKNADEYNYFGGIINELKKSDNKTYEELNSSFNGKLEELMLIRNINVNYKGNDYKVPRKTVKILKKKK
jgi:hypothetical protein